MIPIKCCSFSSVSVVGLVVGALVGVFDISINHIDYRYINTFQNIDIDKAILKNIDIDNDKDIFIRYQ